MKTRVKNSFAIRFDCANSHFFAPLMWAPGLLAQHRSLKQHWSIHSVDPQTVGFFPAVDCCCCRYVGLFTLGFLRLGLLFAFVSWTTKKDRTTIAPKKANTGMVWPTSWLYRPGIIPKEMGKVVNAQRQINIITKEVRSQGGFEIQHQLWLLHTVEVEHHALYSGTNNHLILELLAVLIIIKLYIET